MSVKDWLKDFKDRLSDAVSSSTVSSSVIIGGNNYGTINNGSGDIDTNIKSPIVNKKIDLNKEPVKLNCDLPFSIKIENTVKNKGQGEVSISAPEHVLPHIVTDLRGDELILSVKGKFSCNQPVDITVSSSQLQNLDLSGVGNVTGILNPCKKVLIDNSSTGEVELKIEAESVKVDHSGVGDLTLNGKAQNMKVDMSATGKFDTRGLDCQTVELDSSGVGNVKVFASKVISGEHSGVGNVKIYGGGSVQMDCCGVGSVKINKGLDI